MTSLERAYRCRARCRGAAAVEFALVLPLLMMLLLGTIDYGFFFWQTQVVTNAAREGAREGTLYVSDDATASLNAEAWARQYMTRGFLNGDDPAVSVTPTPNGEEFEVEIIYPSKSLTGFTGYVFPDTIRAVAVMKRPAP